MTRRGHHTMERSGLFNLEDVVVQCLSGYDRQRSWVGNWRGRLHSHLLAILPSVLRSASSRSSCSVHGMLQGQSQGTIRSIINMTYNEVLHVGNLPIKRLFMLMNSTHPLDNLPEKWLPTPMNSMRLL